MRSRIAMEEICPLYYETIKYHPARMVAPPGGHRHFAMAIVGKVKYLGWNNRKTRPQLKRQMPDGSVLAGHHAETHVLYKVPKHKRKYIKLFVMRVTKSGKITMSKPCSHCVESLLTEGISEKNIWYTNHQGEWQCLQDT